MESISISREKRVKERKSLSHIMSSDNAEFKIESENENKVNNVNDIADEILDKPSPELDIETVNLAND